MSNIKFQNYLHYKLPITIKPLEYGKLIEQLGNKYIIQLNTSNVLVIKTIKNDNFIRFYRKGDLMIEFIDSKETNEIFTRVILDQKFTFKNNKLTTTEILSVQGSIKIFQNYEDTNALSINPLKNPIEYFYRTNLFKNYQVELFILMEVVLVLLVILFLVFTDDSETVQMALAAFSSKNIAKLRKTKTNNV
jgi:hypothetical protein